MRIPALLMAGLVLCLSSFAIAGDRQSGHLNDDLQLREAEDYRWKASTLEGKQRELGYRQQWVVAELIDICYRLAETEHALANAIHMQDPMRERSLELKLSDLKAEERQLWDELDRLTK
ncbi:MAG: hypothetical protein JSU82_12490 [Rhodospirillales bacterium]|nr:MAG: hypothetical protein JSU82_12490 [Rhodospirillales bacterium]